MNNKSGQRWNILEVCKLYRLIKSSDVSLSEAEKIMGRSARAFEFKVIKGGLFSEELTPIHPFLSEIQFIRNLRRARQFEIVDIPPHLVSGKLLKIFKRVSFTFESIWSLPDNKRHLIPKSKKSDCRIKHKSKKGWWKFSSDAQSNPFMRSETYKKCEGKCSLCNDPLSEGEYQAHHSCYDHICTFGKVVYTKDRKGAKKSIPDCKSCFLESPDKFKDCLKRLHAVHGSCNKRLYDLEEK